MAQEQLHKRLSTDEVKSILEKYLKGEFPLKSVLTIFNIKRRRFFDLLKKYKQGPESFSIQYKREFPNRKIDQNIESNIIEELKMEKEIIDDPHSPIKIYNYSYVKEQLLKNYDQKVSLPTIISRAKQHGFYFPKKQHIKAHDKEVITNYVGELLQHDSSYHRWAPNANKWHLITTLDDFSRFILYAEFVERDTTIAHIWALECIFLKFGVPPTFYVDSHRIFRFVQSRDSIWRTHEKLTDDVDPQWKQVLKDCNVEVIHALSPQARGKIERTYGWLQDRVVRTCWRENINTIKDANEVLQDELNRYNYRTVHSTTKEIPAIRFERAIKSGKSLFREFRIKPPYQSTKDIFCIRAERRVNGYRKVSLNTVEFKVPNAPLYEKIELRIYPYIKEEFAEVRFWYKDKFLGAQKAKIAELNLQI